MTAIDRESGASVDAVRDEPPDQLAYLDSLDKRPSHERWRQPDADREAAPQGRFIGRPNRRSTENATDAAPSVRP